MNCILLIKIICKLMRKYWGDNKKAPSYEEAEYYCKYTILTSHSRPGIASPPTIKTIQVLAITALRAAFAGVPNLYVKVLIMIDN